MKISDINNNLFGLFKSAKRVQILEYLIKKEENANFNEISKQLNIAPSTLEYHLKQLVDQGLITHINNQYGINAYSKIIWNGIKNLNTTESITNYLKTHILPLDNIKLLNDFIKLKIDVFSDMLSLLSFVKTVDTKNVNKLLVVGIFDLKFEELFLKLIGDVVKIEHFELFMSIDNVIELVAYENFEVFFDMVEIDYSNLFIVEECKYFLAITNKFGVLFLPELNGSIDYQQCLVFNNSKAMSWLEEWFNHVKINARSIKFSKDSYKNKEKILEFIEFLKTRN